MTILDGNLDDLITELRTKFPDYDAAVKRSAPIVKTIGMLIDLRLRKGLKQGEVASRMQRSKSFVSRLESGRGGMPDHETLSRYVRACGGHIGLVVATGDGDNELYVADAVPFDNEEQTIRFFDALPDRVTGAGAVV